MNKILLVTSSYPRWKDDDVTGRFMQDIAQELGRQSELSVLAPLTTFSKITEELDGVKVMRHKQAPFGIEFAYGDGLLPNIRKAPWKLLFLPFFFLIQLISVSALMRIKKYDVLNPHWIIPQGFVCALYKKLFNRNVKIVGYSHGTDLLGLNGALGTWLKKFTLSLMDKLVVTNSQLESKAKSLGFSGPILISPLGVDMQMFHPSKKDQTLQQRYSADQLIIYAGALIRTKGVFELIEAFGSVLKRFPKAKLLLIGAGAVEELKSAAASSGIQANVLFLGTMTHKELSVHLASSDLLIQPSYSEGFSMIVAEAMASGLPVVMTEGIGIAHTIINDPVYSGRGIIELTPPKDPSKLADKMITLLDKPVNSRLDTDAARKFIQENYSWPVLGERIRAFFKSA